MQNPTTSTSSFDSPPQPTENGQPTTFSSPLLQLAQTVRAWDTQIYQIQTQSTSAQRNRAISTVLRCAILNAVRANVDDPEAVGKMGNLYIKLRKTTPLPENLQEHSTNNSDDSNTPTESNSTPDTPTITSAPDSARIATVSIATPATSNSTSSANPPEPTTSIPAESPSGTPTEQLARILKQCDSSIPEITVQSNTADWDGTILCTFHCAILHGLSTNFDDLDAIETLGTLYIKLQQVEASCKAPARKLSVEEVFRQEFGTIGNFPESDDDFPPVA